MNAAVTREQAREFRVAAGLPIEWENPDGVPEPPIDRVERTRQALDFWRASGYSDAALSPDRPVRPDQKDRRDSKSMPPREFGTFLDFQLDRDGMPMTLGEIVARNDSRYEDQWTLAWPFGIAPAARRRCEIEIGAIAAEISGKPLTDFSSDVVLANVLTPRQAELLTLTLIGETRACLFFVDRRFLGVFSSMGASFVIEAGLILGAIVYGIVMGEWWIAAAVVLAAILVVGPALFFGAFSWPVWTKPDRTIAEIAEEMRDQVSRRVEEMLKDAAGV